MNSSRLRLPLEPQLAARGPGLEPQLAARGPGLEPQLAAVGPGPGR